jgi:hypothetical protein
VSDHVAVGVAGEAARGLELDSTWASTPIPTRYTGVRSCI